MKKQMYTSLIIKTEYNTNDGKRATIQPTLRATSLPHKVFETLYAK